PRGAVHPVRRHRGGPGGDAMTDIRTTLLDERNRLRLETVRPFDLDDSSTVVKVLSSGVCGTDLHLLAGHDGKPRPISVGHEFVGEALVVAQGQPTMDGNDVRVGDRVLIEPGFSCGTC